MKKALILVLLVACVSITSLFSGEVKMAIGLSLPPYIIAEKNIGIEYDIVKEALAYKGHTLVPVYVPFARVLKEIETKRVQGALTVNESSGLKDVFFSNSHITYQNAVMSLKNANLTINSLENLSKLRVTGFMNAKLYLGKDYKNAMANNSKYDETNDQEAQVALLFKKRVQALVCDINIFKFYRQNNTKTDTSEEITIHELFPATNYKVAFIDKKLRDDFNEGLKYLRDSGKYKEIVKKYVK